MSYLNRAARNQLSDAEIFQETERLCAADGNPEKLAARAKARQAAIDRSRRQAAARAASPPAKPPGADAAPKPAALATKPIVRRPAPTAWTAMVARRHLAGAPEALSADETEAVRQIAAGGSARGARRGLRTRGDK